MRKWPRPSGRASSASPGAPLVTASTAYREGDVDRLALWSDHAGLTRPKRPYHVVIHLTDQRDFARLVKPFSDLRYPCSSTDQTFSKENYLDDADDVEVTLEMPERLRDVRPSDLAPKFHTDLSSL